jgi:PAS domain S-box-containing protein
MSKATFIEAGVIVALTAGIFLLDLLTPKGIVVWLLYLIPLLVAYVSPRERDPLYFSALFTVLIWLGFLFSPPDAPIPYAVFNRVMGIAVMWAFALAMYNRKKTGRALEQAIVGQKRAETAKDAAVAARELAEASALGAVGREMQTERERQITALRLEGIVRSAMDAIVTVDDHQQVLLFNEAAEKMFRCPAAEAIGQPLDRFIPARFREAHHAHVQAFGRSGVTNRRMGALGTITGLRADGEEFEAEAAISHIVVEGKRFYTVILRDTTERSRIERLIRQSEERYRRLVAISPYAIFINRGDRVTFINEQGLRLFGATKAEEILGKSPFELIHPDCRAMVLERIHQLVEGSQTAPLIEEKIIKLDGTVVDVEVSAARFLDEEGPSILVMVRDISERKRLEEQLRQTERLAEMGSLASGMAHEIGTPMNVILGRAEYLMHRTHDEATKKGLSTIIVQVERITKIMNQLLAFARRRPIERRPTSLPDLIQDSLDVLREHIRRSRITVETAFHPDLRPIPADRDQMIQVVLNLAINAMHAMPDGGALRIGVTPANGNVRITVSDTGHGIPKDAQSRIFDPFFTTKEAGKGTGLGLTVVHGIIQEHGGTIAVESEVERGTTFTITLPLGQQEGAASL